MTNYPKSKNGTPVREMVADWLRANHYDGLCNHDCECGCGLDDLMPCGAGCCDQLNCVCAYRVPAEGGYCACGERRDDGE